MRRPGRRAALLLALLLGIAGCAVPRPASSAPPGLTVVTFNIHHGRGTDGVIDLDRIAAVLRSIDPDLVALQEVDVKTTRSGGVDEAAVIGERLGLHVTFRKSIDHAGGEYGNCVLSRVPPRSVDLVQLPSEYAGEQRTALAVEFEFTGRSLWFLATHFDYRGDDTERLRSAKRIAAWLDERRPDLAILAGDLNATPDSRTLQAIRERWIEATPTELPTYPAGSPERQIDYVLLARKEVDPTWRVLEARVIDDGVASDHRALGVRLELH